MCERCEPLELIPNRKIQPQRFFKTEEEYQRFRKEFYEAVKDGLDECRIARLRSEELSRHHLVDGYIPN